MFKTLEFYKKVKIIDGKESGECSLFDPYNGPFKYEKITMSPHWMFIYEAKFHLIHRVYFNGAYNEDQLNDLIILLKKVIYPYFGIGVGEHLIQPTLDDDGRIYVDFEAAVKVDYEVEQYMGEMPFDNSKKSYADLEAEEDEEFEEQWQDYIDFLSKD